MNKLCLPLVHKSADINLAGSNPTVGTLRDPGSQKFMYQERLEVENVNPIRTASLVCGVFNLDQLVVSKFGAVAFFNSVDCFVVTSATIPSALHWIRPRYKAECSRRRLEARKYGW